MQPTRPSGPPPRKLKGEAFARQEGRNILRFLTCGSVDDGKSTLIGRLLYDSKTIFEDQMTALEAVSKKHGTTGDDIDLALLLDGLQAEQEQGITIDVGLSLLCDRQAQIHRRRYPRP